MFCVLFAIALLSAFVASASAPGPKDIGKSKVYVAQNWSVNFGQVVPPSFSFKTFGFITTPAQKARMESVGFPYTEGKDSLGNLLLDFSFQPKKSIEKLSLNAAVDADYSAPQPGADASAYLQGGQLSKPNAEISSKAQELAALVPTDLEKLVYLTGWVHNRVTYDGAGYGGSIQTAQWVYQNKVGTCDEYSHLLISMLRSANIPAKFVAGFVCSANCTESKNWGLHAWVEAFADGKWVPVDPTFNEAILLDATHLKFAEGKDQDDIKEQLSATGFNYPISEVKVEREISVSLDEWKGFGGIIGISLKVPDKQIGEKSIETVTALVENNAGQPIAAPLSLSVPSEMQVRGEAEALLYLAPHSSRNYSWEVVFPAEFKEGYTYNFTLEASTLGASARSSIIAKKGGDTRQLEAIVVKELTPTFESSSVKVKLDLENSGNTAVQNALVRVEAGEYNSTQTLSLLGGETKALEFTLPAPSGTKSLNGTITLLLEGKQVKQPFNIRVAQPTQQANQTQQNLPELSLNGVPTEIMVLVGAVATVLIFAVALLLLKKS